MLDKVKQKINNFRCYMNNQQSGYIAQATMNELSEINKIQAVPIRSSL